MKVRYNFRVRGALRFPADIAFEFKTRHYEFHEEKGFVAAISVTVPIPNRDDWPTVTRREEAGSMPHVTVPTPGLIFISAELRNLESFLSLFGVKQIDVKNARVEWLPANEEERRALKIFTYERGLADPDPSTLPPLPPDLMARSLIASYDAFETQVPLAFYRRGADDVYERRFLEACYDFLFLLETLYSNGKYRTDQVKDEFRKAPDLQEAIHSFLVDAPLQASLRSQFRPRYDRHIAGKECGEVSDYLVDVRGFIHHHTMRRRGIWHPERQEEFEFDAFVLQHIAFWIAMKMMLGETHKEGLDVASIKLLKRVC
jgi:hypothetical protein